MLGKLKLKIKKQRIMKQKLLFFMAFLLPCLLFAQSRYSVKGNVIGAGATILFRESL